MIAFSVLSSYHLQALLRKANFCFVEDPTIRVFKPFALAGICVALALIFTLLISPLHEQFKFLMFAVAVAVSATGGVWPGVFSTVLSAALADYFLLPPIHQLIGSDPGDLTRLILFVGVGLAFTWLADRFRRYDETIRIAAAVVESTADSIVRQNLDGTILSWNKAAEHIYGYSAREAIGRPSTFTVPPGRLEEMQQLIARVHKGASVCGHETVRTRKDGALIDVALTLSPVEDRKGRVVGVSSIAREISSHKRAEDALRHSLTILERQAHYLKLLAEMGEMLQVSANPEDAYAVTARFAQKLLPGSSGSLYIQSATRGTLELALRWGEPAGIKSDFLASDECWGLRTGRVHLVEVPELGLLCRHLPEPAPSWLICAPMIARGETLGLLHMWIGAGNQAAKDAPIPQSLDLTWPVRTMAERLALTVSDMRLREALRAESICDPLTGWYNRRHMEEALERDICRATRSGRPLSLLMLDIDNFKDFNDAFGHEAGDVALQSMCRMLKSLIRSEDVACRYGGDEFLLILPESSAGFAAQRAEEMRIAVGQTALQYQSRWLKPMTLSYGIATFPEDGRTAHELLRAADFALLRGKRPEHDRARLRGEAPESSAKV